MTLRLVAFAAVLALLAVPLRAGPALPAVHEEVVVTANATPTEPGDVGSSVTVITGEELAARQVTSVLEALRTVPGLEVVQAGGPGRAASVFLRGAASSHTLVLLDGVRLNSPATGACDLAALRADQVERIEVLRGPQSSLYGSDAIGGVIHILTRRGAPGAGLSVEVGNRQAGRLQAGAGGAGSLVDWRVTGSRERLDGVSVASEARGNRESDPFHASSAAAFVGVRLGSDGRAELAVHALEASTGLDGFAWGVGPVDDPTYTEDRRQLTAALSVALPGSSRLRSTLRLGGSRESLEGHDPDTPYNEYHIDTSAAEASWTGDLVLGRHGMLSLGAAHEDRRADSRGSFDERAGISSVWSQAQWTPRAGLHLTAAVRHDRHSSLGGQTTGRVTAAAGHGSWRLHASLGTGFKAPSFNDLYYPYYGNPALRPETSLGWDAGLALEPSGGFVQADVTAFSTATDDLIGFDARTWTATNIARARARGLEASARVSPAAWLRVAGSYTLTDSEDADTGLPLPRRPRHRLTLTAFWQAGSRLSGTLAGHAVRGRLESDGSRLDDYTRLDASVAWHLYPAVAATLRASNLLGAQYEEIAGYTSPGRLVAVGLELQLR